jgi:phage terminase small subunit
MLTAKQEAFVQNILQGMSQADAYRSAYSCKNMSDKTIHEAASRLMSDSKVSARVKELREQLAKETIMSAQERLEWLTRLVKAGSEYSLAAEKIRAIDVMNKMTGEYVQKIEADVKNEVTINIELSDDE